MSWLFTSNRPYIKDHQRTLIINHKYAGQQLSYTYNYFYSPLCGEIASNLPMWLAPNLITMIGFLFNLIPHLLLVLYLNPDLQGDLPNWFCYMVGINYFIYMVFDNTDGKQARRTGSSSPLGMLFDHGLDCVTSLIVNMALQSMLQVGNNFMGVTCLLISIVPFYFAIFEQYYTGQLVLAPINGVDEGSFIILGAGLVTGYYGSVNLMNNRLELAGYSLSYTQVMHHGLLVSAFLMIIPNLLAVYKQRDTSRFKQLYRQEYMISHLLFYPINVTLFLLACYFSPSNIMSSHPRRVQYSLGFQFVLVCLRMQYSAVTLEKLNPFRRTCLLTWALLIAQIISSVALGQSIMHEPTLYLIIASYSFVSIAHLVYFLVTEMTQILDINVFTLTQKQIAAQGATKKD